MVGRVPQTQDSPARDNNPGTLNRTVSQGTFLFRTETGSDHKRERRGIVDDLGGTWQIRSDA